ncbi:alpha/beta hydrolase [Lactobacillus sp. UCMA15818]|uniref:alpha/beta hydrolase n=1 Tax=Lactobacillus sp. UCMA15818 TaxID=2583394 RepID=UPI0025B259DC|nr:alpha/beta hydrolase [Lactobacillus sp. UCMA15818]
MIIKNSAYGEKWGFLDPQVLERTKRKALIFDKVVDKKIVIEDIQLNILRENMGSYNRDLSEENVKINNFLIPCLGRYIPARKYTPNINGNSTKCLVYLHGGGFIGGSIDTVNNQCKLIAERGHCVVISIGYRLAPETPYPGAYLDVVESLEWISNNKAVLGFNDSQIYIAGDSAGGNLAIICGLKNKNNFIRRVISIYGALDMTEKSKTLYKWNYSKYNIAKKHEIYIHTRLNKFALLTKIINVLYTNFEQVENPLISPVYINNFENFPDITLIEAEFDYFLQSNIFFAEKAKALGANVDVVMYKGLDHGFFDRLGFLKQAEDLVNTIVDTMEN